MTIVKVAQQTNKQTRQKQYVPAIATKDINIAKNIDHDQPDMIVSNNCTSYEFHLGLILFNELVKHVPSCRGKSH